jgi:hypothetical protein
MDVAVAMLFALLAVADLAMIVRFRILRRRHERVERMTRSLRLGLELEAFAEAAFPQERPLRRAS